MAFNKKETKKSKFVKCKCGVTTILMICPGCGNPLYKQAAKKAKVEEPRLEEITDEE